MHNPPPSSASHDETPTGEIRLPNFSMQGEPRGATSHGELEIPYEADPEASVGGLYPVMETDYPPNPPKGLVW